MIVIPMAGLSQRFANAGYTKPKYMLMAHNKTLFSHTVSSFLHYFSSEPFLFIYRDIQSTEAFVQAQIKLLGIQEACLVNLGEQKTLGQADTVRIGLERAKVDSSTSVTIFNIDTIRPNFIYPDLIFKDSCDGYLEVFNGQGNNWSFVQESKTQKSHVLKTTEKDRISDLCSTGLYYFRNRMLFDEAFSAGQNNRVNGEIYIAPLYNELIQSGKNILFNKISLSEVIFSGTPEEFDAFKNQNIIP
jgi:hypothetical protein